MRLFRGMGIRKVDTALFLFVPMLLFKLSCDLGYVRLLRKDPLMYPMNFNLTKFIAGIVCCIVLYFLIDHNERKASSFLLYVFFLLQIVPITTIYAFADENSVYYFTLCAAVLICELLVRFGDPKERVERDQITSVLMLLLFAGMTAFTLYRMIRLYGRPNAAALDLFGVYSIRENAPSLGKLLSYLFKWTTAALLPFGLALTISERKYVLAALLAAVCVLLYLYTGHKTILFMTPLVIACSFWVKREHCYRELFFCLCIGFVVLIFLAAREPNHDTGLFSRAYSLLARRPLMVPANNKFKYFDYFSSHPKMGIYGFLPRSIVDLNSFYENVPYTYEISRIYYAKPEMNSNTGFLAEGYMRFGHVGTFLILIFFALILKWIDGFQNRAGYALAVGAFVYPIYALNDAHLLDSLFFGPWMIILLLMMFYNGNMRAAFKIIGRRHSLKQYEQI